MKIAFIITNLSSGGAERVLSLVANYFAKKEHEIKVILLQDAIIDYAIHPNIHVQYIKRKRNGFFSNIQRIWNLRRALKGYEIVFSFLWHINLYTILATRFSTKKVIISDRSDPLNELNDVSPVMIKLRNFCYSQADRIVFQTIGAMNCYPEKIKNLGIIIANPITPNMPYWKDTPKSKKYIATSCRLSAQKNLKMAIDAFCKFHKQYPEYSYYIYGEGELREELERYIVDKQMENIIFLPGFIPNVFKKIAASSMFILTSDYEGISNSMLEALGMGVPTIVTDCPPGGAKAFIDNNKTGILIPVGDVEALYVNMKKIAEDKQFADFISKNSLKIREELDENIICEKWYKLLEEV